MDDPFLMRVLHRLADIGEKGDALRRGEPLLVAVVGDLYPAHQLHDKEGPPERRGPGVEDLGDVRVIHHRQRLPLLLEAGDDLLRVHAHLEDFQGHAPPHRLLLLGHPDRAKAALADLLEQLVRPDALAGFLGFEARELPLDLGGKRGLGIQETRRRGMGGEQPAHFALHVGVIAAGRDEVGFAIGGGAFERGVEGGLDPRPAIGGRCGRRKRRTALGWRRWWKGHGWGALYRIMRNRGGEGIKQSPRFGKVLVISAPGRLHPPLTKSAMPKLSLRDIDVSGQRVLVRVDFNVPVEERDGKSVITDDTRMRESLPTIAYLREHGAKVILMAHFGRPKGKPNPKYSLRPVADHLHTLIGHPVLFSHEVIGEVPEKIIAHMKNGDVALLENVRFHAEEEANDPTFAQALAKLGDVFVNDAFGAAHRAHASTAGVAQYVKKAVAGFLMEKELTYLHDELENPARPFVVILGGAKVSDKIAVINRLLDKADTIIIGGGMAYTFRKLVQGIALGKSLYKPEWEPIAQAALDKAKARGVKLLIPVDALITDAFDFDAKTVGATRNCPAGEDIPDGWEGVDIGPESVKLFAVEIAGAKTVIWNGPMGVFEIKECATGTFAIAEAIAANAGCKSIIGGGDSVTAVKRAGVAEKMTFISTGGGASLELLEGKALPGVTALNDK